MTVRCALVAIPFALVVLAACGGDDDEAGQTTVIEKTVIETAPAPEPEVDTAPDDSAERVRFGVRAGSICKRAGAASDRVRGSLGLDPGQTSFDSLAQVAELTRRENAIRRRALRQLRSIDPPDSLKVRFERYLGGRDRLLIQSEGLLSAALDSDEARARELLRQIRMRGRRNRGLAAAASLGRCAL